MDTLIPSLVVSNNEKKGEGRGEETEAKKIPRDCTVSGSNRDCSKRFVRVFIIKNLEEFESEDASIAAARRLGKVNGNGDFHSFCASLHSPAQRFLTPTENLTRVSASDSCCFRPVIYFFFFSYNIARFFHPYSFFFSFLSFFFFFMFFSHFSFFFVYFKFIFNFNKVLAPIYYITMFHSTPRNCKYINTYM